MNTKRQTIWLVSMLSLMVLLSAYYLFTQDTNDNNALTENNNPKGNVTEVAGQEGNTIVNNEGKSNEEILAQVEREGFADGGEFSNLLTKREQMVDSEYNSIMSVITGVSDNNQEVTAAFAELEKLEDKISKIKSLENQLMEKYEIAHIDQNEDIFNVVVRSSGMNKSEAAEIIEEVMSEMAVKPNQVSVQYLP